MLLAIDTCGVLGGVALGDPLGAENSRTPNRDLGHPRPDFWFRELAGKTHSELLFSAIAGLLREANLGLEQLTGVVVVHGPGSFTGIRIGVSAAKGLAEALAIPLVAVSRLELLARKAADSSARVVSAAAVLDAGRGEFYLGLYRDGVCEAEILLTRDLLPRALGDSRLPVLVCEEPVFAALADLRPELVAPPGATDGLQVGGERFQAESFDEVATLDANYIRRSEAEMLDRIAEHIQRRAAASCQQ